MNLPREKGKRMIAPHKPNAAQHEAVSTARAFERLLTSREAAELLRMHYKTLERWAREGRIPAHFLHRRWFFRASELDTWVVSAVHSSQPIRPLELRSQK